MNLLDVCIILLILASLFRGAEIGFVRQFGSTIGLFAGMLLGAALQAPLTGSIHSVITKSFVTVIITLGCGLFVMVLTEYGAIRLKHRINRPVLHTVDNSAGSVLAAITITIFVWLGSAVLIAIPSAGLRDEIKDSAVVSFLNDHLPPTPNIIAKLSKLVDPNGFPEVFSGNEPTPASTSVTPSLTGFDQAIAADKASVVKLEGQGCGGLVEGSGFVAASGLVATNAHVVAGIERPYVIDANGTHKATVVLFDPDLDFALLRVSNLAGSALGISDITVPNDTKTAILGYPGGGNFDVKSGVIVDEFLANGRDIYGIDKTQRHIYEVKASIIHGNSGGPMITADGKVVGVVFAQSTSYDSVGYALTTQKVRAEIDQAKHRTAAVSTGDCAQ
jgi:S1-C subfamily serine protease